MGHYISIRGWLECPESQIQKVKGIITSFVEKAEDYGLTKDGAEMYNKGWQIPDGHINWTYYMFYGADIRIQQLDYIRDQIIALTDNIYEVDGEYMDYIEGIFDLEDDEEAVFLTWKTRNVNLRKLKRKDNKFHAHGRELR